MALDGTKIEANASLVANRSREWIEAEVKRMLEEAAAKDAEEDKLRGPDRRADELPTDLPDRGKRLSRLKEAKARLEQEAAKQVENIRKRSEEEQKSGRKKRRWNPHAHRSHIARPVLGHAKVLRRCDCFMRRGHGAVDASGG